MLAINHALTGTVLAFALGNPWIALPAAFLSHYVCDAIPHFGSTGDTDRLLASKQFRWQLITDASACVVVVGIIAFNHPAHWLLACICAFLATAPDIFWVNRYIIVLRGKTWHPNWHSRFAAAIQWFERPSGAFVEAAWFIGAGLLASSYL